MGRCCVRISLIRSAIRRGIVAKGEGPLVALVDGEVAVRGGKVKEGHWGRCAHSPAASLLQLLGRRRASTSALQHAQQSRRRLLRHCGIIRSRSRRASPGGRRSLLARRRAAASALLHELRNALRHRAGGQCVGVRASIVVKGMLGMVATCGGPTAPADDNRAAPFAASRADDAAGAEASRVVAAVRRRVGHRH